jgi:hypothetical protein
VEHLEYLLVIPSLIFPVRFWIGYFNLFAGLFDQLEDLLYWNQDQWKWNEIKKKSHQLYISI